MASKKSAHKKNAAMPLPTKVIRQMYKDLKKRLVKQDAHHCQDLQSTDHPMEAKENQQGEMKKPFHPMSE